MSAIILDTETTGIDEPEVISMAVSGEFESPTDICSGGVAVAKFKPSKPISLGALATHHIIDEDLVDCSPWPGKWDPPSQVRYLIGHNADYDWKAIGSPSVRRICTLAFSRHLWPALDSHSLTAMTYYLQGRVRGRQLAQHAHDAEQDVYLCTLLLLEILKLLPGMASWEQVWQASEKARVPTRFSFGKFKGQLIADVRRIDSSYLDWCLRQDFVREDPYLRQALTGRP